MRTTACVLLLLLCTAPRLFGQLVAASAGAVEATLKEADVHPRPCAASGPQIASSDLALGRSSAVRVFIVDPGEDLTPHLSARLGFAESGHFRWRPAFGSGPASDLPGEPICPFHPLDRGLRAPGPTGVWLLENEEGRAATIITRVPATMQSNGSLNGYRIGAYPLANPELGSSYAPPAAFIEVTPENRDLPLSEHLTLGQFLTKDQFEVWPKYLALDPALLDKLELVVQELRSMGVRAEGIHIMSGFRTPDYNGPGGDGRAALSRHMWGDAADFWIDSDGDGRMDDLNGDGRIDIDDAALILRAVERVERRYPELIGGSGIYPDAPRHGPYIHIDVRRNAARW